MRNVVISSVAVLLVGAMMFYQTRTVEPVYFDAPDVAFPELAGFTSERSGISEAEREGLPPDTEVVKCRYVSQAGDWFQVTAVIGGRSRDSIHRPERCLPAQGFQMMSPRDREVGGVGWHLVELARREASSLGFAYTFFNQDGYSTGSHVRRIVHDVWNRSVRGHIDRWVMLTVFSSVSDEARFTAFLDELKGVIAR